MYVFESPYASAIPGFNLTSFGSFSKTLDTRMHTCAGRVQGAGWLVRHHLFPVQAYWYFYRTHREKQGQLLFFTVKEIKWLKIFVMSGEDFNKGLRKGGNCMIGMKKQANVLGVGKIKNGYGDQRT